MEERRYLGVGGIQTKVEISYLVSNFEHQVIYVIQIILDQHLGSGSGGLLRRNARSAERWEVFGGVPRRNDREKDAMKWFG